MSATTRRRFLFGRRAATLVVVLLLTLDAWAMSSADPDYYLPDPFRPIAFVVVVLFLVTGWIRGDGLRRGLRVLVAMSVLGLLGLEMNFRFRASRGGGRIELTDDVLLRYRYRPGYLDFDAGTRENGEALVVNHLGLLDVERAIPKPAGVFRVVVLTGSIANDGAVKYEQRFYRRLEKQLAGAAPEGRAVEVINVSCEGYNAVQQVRLLEKVGLQYEPDVVVEAFMLTAAAIQNGGYRRFGDSFFLFRFLPPMKKALTGSICSMFAPFYDSYTFDLVVRNSFERLDLLRQVHGFRVLVAVLPVVEEYGDPVCSRLYDKVLGVARDSGFATVRAAEAFAGEPASRFAKPNAPYDVAHPNADGHRRIGDAIAAALREMLATPPARGP